MGLFASMPVFAHQACATTSLCVDAGANASGVGVVAIAAWCAGSVPDRLEKWANRLLALGRWMKVTKHGPLPHRENWTHAPVYAFPSGLLLFGGFTFLTMFAASELTQHQFDGKAATDMSSWLLQGAIIFSILNGLGGAIGAFMHPVADSFTKMQAPLLWPWVKEPVGLLMKLPKAVRVKTGGVRDWMVKMAAYGSIVAIIVLEVSK